MAKPPAPDHQIAGPNDIRVDIPDSETRNDVGLLIGLRAALGAIEQERWAADFPGTNVARLAIENAKATVDLRLHRRLTFLALQAGVDLVQYEILWFDGTTSFTCRPFAEAAALTGRAAAG